MKLIKLTLLLTLSLPLISVAQTERIDSLRTYVNPAILELSTVESIIDLSDMLVAEGSSAEAKEWLLLGLEVATRIENNSGKYRTLTRLGDLYLFWEKPDSAAVFIDNAAIYVSNPDQQLENYGQKGTSFSMKRQFVLASEQYERAITLADSLGDARYVAGLNMILGNIYSQLDDNFNALRSYYDAVEFAEINRDSLLMATGNNNVGHKFFQIGSDEQAEYYLLRSETVSREIGSLQDLRRSILNLGNLYSKVGDYDKAEKYYTEALELARSADDRIGQVRIFYNIGLMESRKKNYGEASGLFNLSLEESQKINYIQGVFSSATGLGNLEMEQGNVSRALRWYYRANRALEEDQYTSLRLVSYQNLYNAYKEEGNFNSSLKWLESYNDLTEDLSASEKSRLLAEYEALFNLQQSKQESEILQARQLETEARLEYQRNINMIVFGMVILLLFTAFFLIRTSRKRDEMNQELKKTNEQLNEMNLKVKHQNEELAQINEIKNKLFAIIAHDLRGPLSSLQSLLYLIRDHDLSESEMDEISSMLEKNLQENSSMMDNLLAWAKAQMNGIQLNKREFALKLGIKSVIDQIKFQAEGKGVTLETNLPDEIEVVADYDMIKLVVRNLIANAIKFSKTGGVINVEACEKGDFYEVKVIDNGVGIKKEDQDKIFSKAHFTSRGTENEKGSGLGLMLCKEFIETHGGKLWFESEVGKGTTFIFTIPRKTPEENELPKESSLLEHK
ncbi:MAG: tetratricopeptide repeat protein [Balneolaceae bacterium]|nr:MAG: tetratricopeptide repeat protein [Balneolaceae bacterium]